jgi:choline dehydrogenase
MRPATPPSLGSFDYVIVGAGSAGSALADLLSRDPKIRVAVVEAGGTDKRFFVQMPLGYGKTFYDRRLNWGYRAEPDPGLDGQSDYWPRGRIVGGSGSLNAMVWIRGAHQDYDEWAAAGNTGWSFADVLPVFRAIEDNEAGADRWRGKGGPIHITDPTPMLHPLTRRFIEAGKQAGFRYNPDFNGETQEGVGIYQINTRGGWRCSSARAFLWPALKRKNLALITKAHVTRVLIEEGRATGIELRRGGRLFRLEAKGEVVLAAGAVNTPHLLQLSGIGRGEDQQAAGLPLIHESPAVGHGLQDHLGINYSYRARSESLNALLRSWWGKMMVGSDFLLRGRGPLSLSLNQGGGFVKSRPDLDRPNIQLYLQAISTMTGKVGTRPLLTPDPFPGFNLGLSSCRPSARGTILAKSPDPFAAPAIRPNAFGTEEDRRDMLEGVKLLRRLAAQPALAELIDEELAPGPSVVTDEELMRDCARRSGTVYHPCGTARMGPDPATAVVDPRLRVHGLKGLRIADASIFPAVISGNTNAAAIMVGVKGAGMILEDGR